jgi:hypothetical protein
LPVSGQSGAARGKSSILLIHGIACSWCYYCLRLRAHKKERWRCMCGYEIETLSRHDTTAESSLPCPCHVRWSGVHFFFYANPVVCPSLSPAAALTGEVALPDALLLPCLQVASLKSPLPDGNSPCVQSWCSGHMRPNSSSGGGGQKPGSQHPAAPPGVCIPRSFIGVGPDGAFDYFLWRVGAGLLQYDFLCSPCLGS